MLEICPALKLMFDLVLSWYGFSFLVEEFTDQVSLELLIVIVCYVFQSFTKFIYKNWVIDPVLV